jgi:prolipoprotein diacylglyceryltransferase
MSVITRILLYDASFLVGFALLLTHSLLRCKTYRISRARAAVYSFLTLLSGGVGATLVAMLYNALAAVKGVTLEVYVEQLGALFFVPPLLAAAVAAEKRFLRRKRTSAGETQAAPVKTVIFRDTMDLIIPGALLLLTVTKIGCHIRGCCYGVECSWGIYLPNVDITLFPVQIFECITTLLAFIATYCVQQAGFFRRGMSLPFGAGLFAAARFFWEFFRHHEPEMRHFAIGLTLGQILSLLFVVVFAVWFAVLLKTQPAEPLPKGKLVLMVEKLLPNKKRQQKKSGAAKNGNNAVRGKKRNKKKKTH